MNVSVPFSGNQTNTDSIYEQIFDCGVVMSIVKSQQVPFVVPLTSLSPLHTEGGPETNVENKYTSVESWIDATEVEDTNQRLKSLIILSTPSSSLEDPTPYPPSTPPPPVPHLSSDTWLISTESEVDEQKEETKDGKLDIYYR